MLVEDFVALKSRKQAETLENMLVTNMLSFDAPLPYLHLR